MLTVLGGLAEFERELIKIRTSEAGRSRPNEHGPSLLGGGSSCCASAALTLADRKNYSGFGGS
jgi:hypothetical protein